MAVEEEQSGTTTYKVICLLTVLEEIICASRASTSDQGGLFGC